MCVIVYQQACTHAHTHAHTHTHTHTHLVIKHVSFAGVGVSRAAEPRLGANFAEELVHSPSRILERLVVLAVGLLPDAALVLQHITNGYRPVTTGYNRLQPDAARLQPVTARSPPVTTGYRPDVLHTCTYLYIHLHMNTSPYTCT